MKLFKFKTKISSWPLVILGLLVVIFFQSFFLKGKLPLPADTIVGMYHPWRDVVWDGLVAGVPFKNFLITDVVRQLYPWRQLAINLLKKGQWPLWNPYTFSGQPLLANFQSGVFSPFNLLFFFLPFSWAWSLMIFAQPLLAGFFTYFFCRQLKLSREAALLGALAFSFSGFFIAWLEWGNILQTALWLPLILLAIEKLIGEKKRLKWSLVLLVSLCFQFFAGHLQTSFYLIVFSLVYAFWRIRAKKKQAFPLFKLFLLIYLIFFILTAIQWLPTGEMIRFSARDIDQNQFQQPGWFLPWQNLVQFLAPDFFGNPTTLNYWGIFNYGEFIGYLGLLPLLLVFLSFLGQKRRGELFFGLTALISLSFALPTPWAKFLYQIKVPWLATSQPTRLLFLVDFSLAILAAFGLEALRQKKLTFKRAILVLILFGLFFGGLWLFVLQAKNFFPGADWLANLAISQRNLILPTVLFLTSALLILAFFWQKVSRKIIFFFLFLLLVFDLFRFGWKFTPFTKEEWLFPKTKTIEFLQKDQSLYRLMTTDRRLFPPNFTLPYKLQTVEGYDPLYLLRYAELIAASERGEANISPPFGFNRIITPHNYRSRLINLMNVKYVLSLQDEDFPQLVKVFQEGETRVYENKAVFSRAFMVYDFRVTQDKQGVIDLMMNPEIDLAQTAILEQSPENIDLSPGENQVEIKNYQENEIELEVETSQAGLLVLTDAYYPGWRAKVDGQGVPLYRIDYHFRGVFLPQGEHKVDFIYQSDSFRIGVILSLIGLIFLGGFLIYEKKNRGRAAP